MVRKSYGWSFRFLNQEPELDSLEIIHRQEIDEWITNLDWNRMDKNYKAYLENMIQTGEEYNIYFLIQLIRDILLLNYLIIISMLIRHLILIPGNIMDISEMMAEGLIR